MNLRPHPRLPVATIRGCFLLLGIAATLTGAGDLVAQRPGTGPDTAAARRALEQQYGRSLSHGEILERLRQSGMSRAEVRSRLEQAGYDPRLADPYFDALERGGDLPKEEPSPQFIEALDRAGLSGRQSSPPDSLPLQSASDEQLGDTIADGRIEVFGLRIFRRAGRLFEPILQGPVDSGYRLGPGDEILLVLTGDVEAAYTLNVSREGFLFIPDVGQVNVNGLTLAQLQDVLYTRLGRVYSGVTRSPNATTRFHVSLGGLRVNQVVVTGDVAVPGSYQVSSVAGLFNALYQAGGPTVDGSFRRIEIYRGGRIAHVADLYDFLVRGDGASDLRLEHNDRIFVPPAGAQVRIEGSVRRPAIYEIAPGEGLGTLIGFAGGLRSDALVRRVQIDRIVPPAEQRPGFYRDLVNVDLATLGPGALDVPLTDGDVVHVFAVSDVRRNRVWVEGEVRNPGVYQWSPASTLWSMLERADGLAELAYTPRAHIFRLVESDGTRRLIPASLERDEAGRPLHDLPLADNDSIVVLSRSELRTPEFVTIDGYVKEPGTYPLARGMSLQDLILAAGGFEYGAYVLEAELSRIPNPLQRTDTTAYVVRVPLNSQHSSSGRLNGDDVVPRWLPQLDEIELVHGDRIFIRRAPGYEPVREVRITGEVLTPGRYVLTRRDERLTDVLERAGGLTPQAFPGGIHVVRRDRVVAADLQRALRNPRDNNNIRLAEGDSIHVPAFDPTVIVNGAVNFESRVLYVPGRGLDYYINQAGGYQDDADKRRVTVTYANGERTAVSRGWLGDRTRVQPGSEVFVPAKPPGSGVNWDQIVGRSAAILSAAALLVSVVNQVR